MPLPEDGAGSYYAVLDWKLASLFVIPDNRADQAYQVYQANTVKLYCTDFETDPFAAGWTTMAGSGETSPWAWSVPSRAISARRRRTRPSRSRPTSAR